MSIEMSVKMSIDMPAENPILGTQRYFRWKQENGYVHQNVSREPDFGKWQNIGTKTHGKHTHTHTAKSKIPENPGIPSVRGHFCVLIKDSHYKCLFFTIVHIICGVFAAFSHKDSPEQLDFNDFDKRCNVFLILFALFCIFTKGFSLTVARFERFWWNMSYICSLVCVFIIWSRNKGK